MADIRDSKNWSFETRQLHIGQEQADPGDEWERKVHHGDQQRADHIQEKQPQMGTEIA